jgi:acetyltransferase
MGFPVAMKVIGPVHKSDLGGVCLDVNTTDEVEKNIERLMSIQGATGVLIQPMLSGTEIFAGVTYEENFGHMIMCGMGGVLIEILKDFSTELAPIGRETALNMISRLNSYPILKGYRGKEGIDINSFADILAGLSALVGAAPEIREMDINPILGSSKGLFAVDTRIRIAK